MFYGGFIKMKKKFLAIAFCAISMASFAQIKGGKDSAQLQMTVNGVVKPGEGAYLINITEINDSGNHTSASLANAQALTIQMPVAYSPKTGTGTAVKANAKFNVVKDDNSPLIATKGGSLKAAFAQNQTKQFNVQVNGLGTTTEVGMMAATLTFPDITDTAMLTAEGTVDLTMTPKSNITTQTNYTMGDIIQFTYTAGGGH